MKKWTRMEKIEEALSQVGQLHMTAIENATGINESDPEIMKSCEKDVIAYGFTLQLLEQEKKKELKKKKPKAPEREHDEWCRCSNCWKPNR